jgi:divalent metal cation (Fe/Co/Zn/Cd) transporter
VETSVARELGGRVRVDSHIEPLKRTALGRDVTSAETDLVAVVERSALEEPDVLDCHEVLITSSEGGLSVVAHVRGRKDLPLARLHDASERIEKKVHAVHPGVAEVLIHFEPAEG